VAGGGDAGFEHHGLAGGVGEFGEEDAGGSPGAWGCGLGGGEVGQGLGVCGLGQGDGHVGQVAAGAHLALGAV